jgi:hypothetical protein
MKEYLNITRNPIFVTMRTLLFFIPLLLITYNLHEANYGVLKFSFQSISDFHIIFFLSVFSALSLFAYFIESVLLPFVLIGIDKKYNENDLSFNKSINSTDKVLKKFLSFNPFQKIKEVPNKKMLRFEICRDLMYYVVTSCLWLIAFNTTIAYFSILIVLVITFYLYKIVNTYFYKYGIEDESNDPSPEV